VRVNIFLSRLTENGRSQPRLSKSFGLPSLIFPPIFDFSDKTWNFLLTLLLLDYATRLATKHCWIV